MSNKLTRIITAILIATGCMAGFCAEIHPKDAGTIRKEAFDKDPGWDGQNNRAARKLKPETIKQDFGYNPNTNHTGGKPGEIGGRVFPASEPAYYAKSIPALTLNNRISASGRMLVGKGGSNMLFGFFNNTTINEWRTPNAIVWRINGRGEVYHAHMEFMTGKWRATSGVIERYDSASDRNLLVELPCGVVQDWSFEYDPSGDSGNGAISFSVAGIRSSVNLTPGFKADGAVFNQFGILNVIKSYDGAGDIWIDRLVINGKTQNLDRDPKWVGLRNRSTYATRGLRPRFDFGFSPTRYAGGSSSGELGGTIYRGDCRYPDKMAGYGDRIDALTLDRPLYASGKVTMRRGVSDSTTSFGFYNSTHSLAVSDSQKYGTPRDFLGIYIEGPSRDGFYFYPFYRGHAGDPAPGYPKDPPHILPDGSVHDWTLIYNPDEAEGKGRITVTLDGRTSSRDLAPGVKQSGTVFDRFGIVTSWIDGNAQEVYLDDLQYTYRQD